MQEIKKTRIVIASVLKPAVDTRMHDKLALTLAEHYEVDVIGSGNGPHVQASHPNVRLHYTGSFKRISLARIIAPWKILFRTISLRPAIFIITTHELLLQGVILRMMGTRLWYDVQENYYLNIRHTNAFPTFLRVPLAWWVRLKERMVSRLVERFLLAERTYLQELPFIGNRFLVLQNKARKSDFIQRDKLRGRRRLLFSGTINKSTGAFDAVRLTSALHTVDSSISLLIIGQCSLEHERRELEALVKDKPFITLQVSETSIPHERIIEAIGQSDLGLILYPPGPSTRNRIPTKLYEYMAARLPVLMIDNPVWISLTAPFNAGIFIDWSRFKASSLLSSIDQMTFYTSDPQSVYWEYEAPKLLKIL